VSKKLVPLPLAWVILVMKVSMECEVMILEERCEVGRLAAGSRPLAGWGSLPPRQNVPAHANAIPPWTEEGRLPIVSLCSR
jgi:hypothetical protein